MLKDIRKKRIPVTRHSWVGHHVFLSTLQPTSRLRPVTTYGSFTRDITNLKNTSRPVNHITQGGAFLNTQDNIMIFSIYIINKAGGLVYNKDYSEGLNKLSSNEYLVLAGTFHG